jgi:hypothetical protein
MGTGRRVVLTMDSVSSVCHPTYYMDGGTTSNQATSRGHEEYIVALTCGFVTVITKRLIAVGRQKKKKRTKNHKQNRR